jgi:4-hydroxy-tetrahydrodipicolinate reductase
MLKIAVAGAAGRMGGRISALSGEYKGLELAGGFERQGHEALGRDVGELAGAGSLGVKLTEGVLSVIEAADVIIDFTAPEATIANMEAAADKGRAMVIGTTGIDKAGQDRIRDLSAKVPCVYAGNMSLGINLLTKIVGDMARALGADYDVEVVEAHHKMKKDAPSGTAFMLAGAAADALGLDLDKDGVFERHGIIGERRKGEIGVQTIRGGDVVGEHTVMFLGMGERIEVSHRVSNRDTFARGALKAALWIKGKGPGLYNMQDVLGLR